MKKKRKVVLWVVVLGLLSAVTIGYAIWNKPHPKVEDQEATAIDAQVLYTAFSGNEQAANKTYLNKVLAVTGTAAEVNKNHDGKTVALLQVNDPMGGVQCTFRDDVAIQPGQKITVKGFCNGYTMVAVLNDCVLQK